MLTPEGASRVRAHRRMVAAGKNGSGGEQRVPLTDARFRIVGDALLVLARRTPWGVRLEYVDLRLRQPLYVTYARSRPGSKRRPRNDEAGR